MTSGVRIPRRMYDYLAGTQDWADAIARCKFDPEDEVHVLLTKVEVLPERSDGSRFLPDDQVTELMLEHLEDKAEWFAEASSDEARHDARARADMRAGRCVARDARYALVRKRAQSEASR